MKQPPLVTGLADLPHDAGACVSSRSDVGHLLDRLDAHADRMPDRPFLVHWQDGRYVIQTFGDLRDTSMRVARTLSLLAGESTSDVVLLFLKHHPLQASAYIGVMMAGLIPSFMSFPTPKQHPELYWESHAALIRRIRPRAIVAYDEILERLLPLAAEVGAKLVAIDRITEENGPFVRNERDDGDTALLQHSSGTTGLKKGVALTFSQIRAQAEAYSRTIDLSEKSIIVSWLPWYHDMGLFTALLIPLTVGATVIAMDAFEWVAKPDLLFQLIDRFRGTHCWLPNFAFQHLVNTASAEDGSATYRLDSMKLFTSCSEPVKHATLEAFADAFASSGVRAEQLAACYAMAETGFAVSHSPAGRRAPVRWYDADLLASRGRAVASTPDRPRSVPLVSNGAPLSGAEVCILPLQQSADRLRTADEEPGLRVGEIAVRGRFVFAGYHEDPSTTEAALASGWYRTGDIGFLDDGELFISGRIKDIIIVHGRNYYAHDIEEIISREKGALPGRSVAIGVSNAQTGSEDVVVLAETRAENDDAQRALKRAIKQSIFSHLELTIHSVLLVRPGWLTKTSSGKISRSENLARYRAEQEATARG